MAFCPECMLYIVAAVFSVAGIVYLYFANIYKYWERRGVPCLPASVPFGSMKDVAFRRTPITTVFQDIYKRLDGHKYGGVFQFHRPTLVLRDPDVIKNFLAKDFNNFHDRGIYFDEENDPISAHLFFMTGQKWRNMRAKLTPTFTSGKIKMMFQTILDCGLQLTDCLEERAKKGETIEIKDICARYTTDVIASCAFGVQCNSLKDPDAEFRLRGREFFEPGLKFSVGLLLNFMAPSLGSKVSWGQTPPHLSKFFRQVVKETVEYREKNNVTRNDFMQLLIQLKNKGYVDVDKDTIREDREEQNSLKKLSIDNLAAQAFVFFLAGFETSSTTMSFTLYEMALNPDLQTRLYEEMTHVLEKHGGQVTYDAIQDMEYLDKVVAETLRKYPPLGILNRECTIAYKLPDSDVVLEPGTQVVVPVLALHHDPLYFPEPERFDPERFTSEAKKDRRHYTYMPFGEGPRICIGMRFAYVQTKIGLISLLSNYEVKVCAKTPIPLIYNPGTIVVSTMGGIFLQFVKRDRHD